MTDKRQSILLLEREQFKSGKVYLLLVCCKKIFLVLSGRINDCI